MEINNQLYPNLYCIDGDWELNAKQWESGKVRNIILANNSKAIINGLLQGYVDYIILEQNFPATHLIFN